MCDACISVRRDYPNESVRLTPYQANSKCFHGDFSIFQDNSFFCKKQFLFSVDKEIFPLFSSFPKKEHDVRLILFLCICPKHSYFPFLCPANDPFPVDVAFFNMHIGIRGKEVPAPFTSDTLQKACRSFHQYPYFPRKGSLARQFHLRRHEAPFPFHGKHLRPAEDEKTGKAPRLRNHGPVRRNFTGSGAASRFE